MKMSIILLLLQIIMCILIHYSFYFMFLEVRLMGQRLNAYAVLTIFTKFFLALTLPFCLLASSMRVPVFSVLPTKYVAELLLND